MHYSARFAISVCTLMLLASCASVPTSGKAGQIEMSKNPATSPVSDETYRRDVAALRLDESVAKALEKIEADRAQNNALLVELTEIPAPPFAESERAARFAEILRQEGLSDVTIDSTGNVIGLRPGLDGRKTLAIAAHLDTVFPANTDVKVKIDGDKFTAPGIGDNTRGLVALISVLRAMNATNLQTSDNILFVGSVGEEGLGDLRGVKALFSPEGPKIDSFIAVDGGSAGRLIHGAIGSHRYRVKISGPGGHSWGRFGDANPHHALGRAMTRFTEAAVSVSEKGPKTSFNVGRIGGGTSVNSIPFESWMEVDMRSGDQKKLDEMDAVFRKAMLEGLNEENQARKSGPELTLSIEPVGKRPAGEVDPSSPLVQRAAASMESLGVVPSLQKSSTDANIPISMGVPAITVSRGGKSVGAHGFEEYWIDEDSHVGLQVLLMTVLQQADYVP